MVSIKTISPKIAKVWLDNKEAIIIDVRDPSEYAEQHIAGAILIPVATIQEELLPELKGKKLIVHCKFGRRGGTACEKLLTQNPNLDVYNLEGGLSAWEQAGLKVEK